MSRSSRRPTTSRADRARTLPRRVRVGVRPRLASDTADAAPAGAPIA
jgi:hypothetical protein